MPYILHDQIFIFKYTEVHGAEWSSGLGVCPVSLVL